ncbi:MAG: methyltransferase domain-containing protein, partial [bacterium]
ARRAAVTVLGRDPTALALLRAVAAQEGVALTVCAGTLAAAPLAAARGDVVVLYAGLGDAASDRDAATLAAAARLLAPGGLVVLATPTDAPAGEAAETASVADAAAADLRRFDAVFATVRLRIAAAYACFPDHQAPTHLVALPLLPDFLATWAAPEVPRAIRPPGYAFFLRAEAGV